MNTFKVDFKGFDELRAKLNKLEANTEQIAIEALKVTNDIVYEAAKAGIQKPNLPAGGKYSTGNSERSLRKDPIIEIQGTNVIAHVGFDLKTGGYPTIFLMYGTPKMPKVQALYDAFYGQEGRIAQAQKEVFLKALEQYT